MIAHLKITEILRRYKFRWCSRENVFSFKEGRGLKQSLLIFNRCHVKVFCCTWTCGRIALKLSARSLSDRPLWQGWQSKYPEYSRNPSPQPDTLIKAQALQETLREETEGKGNEEKIQSEILYSKLFTHSCAQLPPRLIQGKMALFNSIDILTVVEIS